MAEEGEKPLAVDAFFLPEEGDADPRPIVARLVAELEEFSHLKHGEAVVMVVMRGAEKQKNGKVILGEMALPRFQGSLGAFGLWLLAKACGGELPDFLLILDAEFWNGATAWQREALVHHELMHAAHATDKDGEPKFTDEGLPIWGIAAHSLEEFNETVTRYGAWLPDIAGFIAAARAGGAA